VQETQCRSVYSILDYNNLGC